MDLLETPDFNQQFGHAPHRFTWPDAKFSALRTHGICSIFGLHQGLGMASEHTSLKNHGLGFPLALHWRCIVWPFCRSCLFLGGSISGHRSGYGTKYSAFGSAVITKPHSVLYDPSLTSILLETILCRLPRVHRAQHVRCRRPHRISASRFTSSRACDVMPPSPAW